MSAEADYRVRIHAHYKEGSASMVKTFSGLFEGYSWPIEQVAADAFKHVSSQPGFPAAPTRLVLSIYRKKGWE